MTTTYPSLSKKPIKRIKYDKKTLDEVKKVVKEYALGLKKQQELENACKLFQNLFFKK
jgi:hypothetical protein